MTLDDIDYGCSQLIVVVCVVVLMSLCLVLTFGWKQLKERGLSIAIAMVAVIIAIAAITMTAGYANNHMYVRKYDQGFTYEKEGEYVKAYEIYYSINDYHDAVDGMNRIYLPYRYQLAGQMRDSGSLLDAVVTYAQIFEYKDSEQLMRDTMDEYLKMRTLER